ncbi:MAG: cyanase [Croceicoccus sp.]|uniref:cyanase n=1 Tax=Altererythrobacter sp. MTPC7 TaxID=3056567 RepID=UPI000C55B8CC|nr:cyanase [Croceicoccus sp.]QPL38735.1 cyanase [Erythrobacter sp. A30-3]HAG36471.1 cyanase [Erythrobacter sp.]|tara:strand:+ start:3911 stop:4354 length:444 start_codon:yes stop_codon:yes gene_type:complete
MLTKSEVITLIRAAKREKKIGWSEIAAAAGGSEIFVTSACLGMNSLSEDASRKVVDLLGLPDEAAVVLAEYPTKHFEKTVPTDPCIYRWYEITGVFGEAFKEVVQEKFGDGIMSAIDFDMAVERVEHEKGDRVQVVMSGKFLPYKSF